jgi:hypothetical protein
MWWAGRPVLDASYEDDRQPEYALLVRVGVSPIEG